MTPEELARRLAFNAAEEKFNKRIRHLTTRAIEAGISCSRFIRLAKIEYRKAYRELELASSEAPEDSEAVARKRQRRAEQPALQAEREFQERTRAQLPEFKVVFERLMERARVAADKRTARDKEHYRQRSFEELVLDSFSSRLRTVLWRRRHDWRFGDVKRWLVALGIDELDASDIMERYQKERFDKIYSASELPDKRGTREITVSDDEVRRKKAPRGG